ncbi:MAG TPA: Uma2 family endonuclease [Kamptonema sp.]|nr:Uma2 family endonuclease [Kamptonema sp.]
MTTAAEKTFLPPPFPDHTQLPEEDGTFVKNFQEHPQSIILTDSIGPVLERLHPDGQYAIGQDCGIYWRETDPLEKGAEAPDWFYVPNVPPTLGGQIRRSYVLWREFMAPMIALEFASGDGSEERDTTPLSYSEVGTTQRPGKFWVYERIMRIPYYGIYEIGTGRLEVYNFNNGFYQQLVPNERGHFAIAPLNLELGLWRGSYQNQTMLWLRWWDSEGNLLLTGAERAAVEQERASLAEQALSATEQALSATEQALSAETRSRRAAIPRLLAMGLNLEQVAEALGLSLDEVSQYSQS